MTSLEAALGSGGVLSGSEVNYIAGFFEPVKIKRGEEFLSIGYISNQIGFVENGILRAYSLRGNFQENTKYFIQKNQFVVDIQSFYDNTSSSSGIQAVTDCRILSLKKKDWSNLTKKIPHLFYLTKNLTEAALLDKIKSNEFMHFGSAKEKYLEFIHRYPDLALHTPLQYIASYLQITPQSLSRIRRELTA